MSYYLVSSLLVVKLIVFSMLWESSPPYFSVKTTNTHLLLCPSSVYDLEVPFKQVFSYCFLAGDQEKCTNTQRFCAVISPPGHKERSLLAQVTVDKIYSLYSNIYSDVDEVNMRHQQWTVFIVWDSLFLLPFLHRSSIKETLSKREF